MGAIEKNSEEEGGMGDGPLEVVPEEGEAGVGEKRRIFLARLHEVAKLAELGGIHGLGSLPFPWLGFS